MHLLYARFWTKVMADAGIVTFREPFPVLRSQGVMHARDADTGQVRRMSKSAGNVVTPDEMAQIYGADALRVYLLFMAPFENNTIWDEEGMVGAKRFVERVWRLVNDVVDTSRPVQHEIEVALRRTIHNTVRRVTADVEAFKFNTAVAALMECLNAMVAHRQAAGVTEQLVDAARTVVLLLAPFAPHMAEELWSRLGQPYSVHQQAWPEWDEAAVAEETITLVVQVDGRVRDRIVASVNVSEAEARTMALSCEGARRHVSNRRVARVVYVPRRLLNIVTER
jgi:leucyl-tRNA synthetase